MTSEQKNAAFKTLCQFLSMLDQLYGMYADACGGIDLWGGRWSQIVSERQIKPGHRVFYGKGPPTAPDAKYQHSALIEDIVKRNEKDGANEALLSQSVITFVFTIWETVIRPDVAAILNVQVREISSDVFGDLRQYRHAILHKNGALDKQPKVLKFLKMGDRVVLTRVQMAELFAVLFEEVNAISKHLTGRMIGVNFNRNLNKATN